MKDNILVLDGGMGTLLQARGLMPGELPERWCITHPEVVTEIHRSYFEAGSNVVSTNTFGANMLKYEKDELRQIISAAVACARAAAGGAENRFVALDVGPLGRMLKPYGDLDFLRAVDIFGETVRIGAELGVDLVFIETMSDSYETKAALLAAKENSSLPVFVSSAFGEDGKLMTGADPLAMIAMLEGMGADAIGVNCSLGPRALAPVVREYLKYSSLPVILKPNAGMPRLVGGATAYDVTPSEFAREVSALVGEGVRIVGGCCGTTPEYIEKTASSVSGLRPIPVLKKDISLVSSYTHAVKIGETHVIIGERINPTGKRRFKEALVSGDVSYILGEGIAEADAGADILDVNVGLPEIDERDMLTRVTRELQAVVDLPLQIDTSDPVAMEAALRIYNGKAMINSVNGKAESMARVFPLVKKYGGVVVALTLDEEGIPTSAAGRLAIARRILKTAEAYGIEKKDIIFDPLALAVSADKNAARETLLAVELISKELGAHTSLGVSNISFGLPMRDSVNASFFTSAMTLGLSAAIINPHSAAMMDAYRSYLALAGLDESFAGYISHAERRLAEAASAPSAAKAAAAAGMTADVSKKEAEAPETALRRAIIRGLRADARAIAAELIVTRDPLSVINEEIIPALNTVGVGFEKKTVYLPQLLMAAEAAGEAFSVISSAVPKEKGEGGCRIVLATVKGDIHDIGKNIVKLLLESYGFDVTDLGRDVEPREVLRAVLKTGAPIVGLSALMTTTVPAMKETVEIIHLEAPGTRVIVGGAVLTQEYAEKIGADKYAPDAMAAVRYAEEINAKLKNK